MKILVCGTLKKEKAEEYRAEAELLGKLLAEKGHELVSGAGTGTSEIVVNSYRASGGKSYTAYLVLESEMLKVGELLGPQPDNIIQTNLDYAQRNAVMVSQCDAAVVMPGSLGTFTELIHCVNDYNKKVAVFNRGEVALWAQLIPSISSKCYFTRDMNVAVAYLEK